MEIGRNDLCPCGSGKKFKKCCIGKSNEEIKLMMMLNPLGYHENYIRNKKVISPKINKILFSIYDNEDNMNIKDIVDGYLEVMNYAIDYAKKHEIRTIEKLDSCELVGDFFINIIGNFDDVILNLKKDEYDFNLIVDYIDKLLDQFILEDNMYLNLLREKANLLFQLGRIDEGENIMVDYLKDNPKETYAYVELVDSFEMVGNLEKAKYYYDLGLSQGNMKDIDALEEREYMFK